MAWEHVACDSCWSQLTWSKIASIRSCNWYGITVWGLRGCDQFWTGQFCPACAEVARCVAGCCACINRRRSPIGAATDVVAATCARMPCGVVAWPIGDLLGWRLQPGHQKVMWMAVFGRFCWYSPYGPCCVAHDIDIYRLLSHYNPLVPL